MLIAHDGLSYCLQSSPSAILIHFFADTDTPRLKRSLIQQIPMWDQARPLFRGSEHACPSS